MNRAGAHTLRKLRGLSFTGLWAGMGPSPAFLHRVGLVRVYPISLPDLFPKGVLWPNRPNYNNNKIVDTVTVMRGGSPKAHKLIR